MAPRALLLAALLAGALIGCALGQQKNVSMKVYVEGTVSIFQSITAPPKESFVMPPARKSEFIYTLIDTAAGNSSAFAAIRVNFSDTAASLLSDGDRVQVPLTLELPLEKALLLGLDPGLASEHAAGGNGGRRLLSEAHQQARRMVLDFHNTRRSVQEMQTLLGLLNILELPSLNQVAKSSDEPLIVEKSAEKDLFVVNGTQREIRSVTFVFSSSSCNVFPPLDSNDIRQLWFNSNNNGNGTLQNYFETCSYNQLTFNQEVNPIFDVDIPCVGATAAGPYNFRTGYGNGKNADNELFALPALAKSFLRRNYPGILDNWPTYRRQIFIYPFNFERQWLNSYATAQFGCSAQASNCWTWINPSMRESSLDIARVFQALASNTGLKSSDTPSLPYGDPSDPLGYTWVNGIRENITCVNAPQSYKAGWSTPISQGHISAFTLPPGVHREFTLPAMGLNKSNHLRIITDNSTGFIDESSPKSQRALFVSYRVSSEEAGGYDSGLYQGWNSRVWIHEFDSRANGQPAVKPSVLLRVLANEKRYPIIPGWGVLGNNFTIALPNGGGVTIFFKSKTSSSAKVSVCRSLTQNEAASKSTCSDGLDNDCDGRVDAEDPDCASIINKAPPPAMNKAKSATRPPPPESLMESLGGIHFDV
ncbi:hypothetical protein Vretimale_3190 [Volvox reticuliferus]|uniref:Peptidase M11 gametolysin domain-containing protein n=1 Tax=Volvox reticuliferus TaxID=1737510 RepID=A0A8J4D820_9CHLO|nr:hypothetical protein Vretimale_3190 [Volvox reticuliferus]